MNKMDANNCLLIELKKGSMSRNNSSDLDEKLYPDNREIKRETWSNNLQSFLSVLGGIIGLGNIWRFPYITYAHGGGAFLIPYALFALLCGFPMLFTEIALGQHRRGGAVKVWDIAPMMRGIGIGCTLIITYSNIYYIVVMAWAIFYFVHSLTSATLPWMHCENWWNSDNCLSHEMFVNVSSNDTDLFNGNNTGKMLPIVEFWNNYVLRKSSGLQGVGTLENWPMLLCLIAAWVLVYFCIFKGVKSVGKAVYFTAIFPYVILAILIVQACTLEGASEGIVYYLRPNMTKLQDPNVWVQAGTQVCYSYAICFAVLVTLGSYNEYHMDCYKHSIMLSVSCSATSFAAGIAVFGVLGHMATVMHKEVDNVVASGPGLAFITYPFALSLLGLPQLWNGLFFLMIIVIAVDSQFSGVEGMLTTISDHWEKAKQHKEFASAIACFILFLFGIMLITNGGIYVFELFNNYTVGGIALLWLVLMQSITVGWMYGADNFYEDVHDMIGYYPSIYLKFCIRFATPILTLLVILYYIVKFAPLVVHGYVFPPWANAIGWMSCLSSMLCVPCYAIYNVLHNEGTFRQKVATGMKPIRQQKKRTK